MSRLAEFLSKVQIGSPQTYANLSIYPLRLPNGHQRGYRTLDEALQAGEVEIKEVNEFGSVPTLSVVNSGKLPILLIVGEELVGAKQNRVLNTSLLVPAETELQIPVSCVERGRWAYRERSFSSDRTTSHLSLRRVQTENVTSSLRAYAAYDADQGAVWREVDRKLASHGASSTTSARHDVYLQEETSLKEYLEAFTVPEAEGVLVTINNAIAGADLFDHHETLRLLWDKLLRGYALDALERQHMPAAENMDDTAQFITSSLRTAEEVYDSVGLGQDVRLSSDAVTGSSLVWGERPVHTSLFNAQV